MASPPRLIQKWGDGRVGVPERFALALRSLLLTNRADALLSASKFAPCPTADSFSARLRAGEALTTDELLDLDRHARHCKACQAREQYVTERLGPRPKPEPPNTIIGRLYLWVVERIFQLPGWARPAAGGAALLFAFVGARVVVVVPFIVLTGGHIRNGVVTMLLAPFAAALGGAAGGLGYSFLGKPLRNIRLVGPYLAGIVTVCAYMMALQWVLWLTGDPFLKDKSDGFIFVGVSIFFGLVVGKTWFKADDDEKEQHLKDRARRASGVL